MNPHYKRMIRLRDGTVRALLPGESFGMLPDGASIYVPLTLMDAGPTIRLADGSTRQMPPGVRELPPGATIVDADDDRAKADQAHAEMVRFLTMAHRHPSDREPPPADREQAYAKMKADISNAWKETVKE
jgi:hypothetical protein